MDYDADVVAPGDKFSKEAFAVCRNSFKNSPAVEIIQPGDGHFRGSRGFRWGGYVLEDMAQGRAYEEAQSDGAGGKLQFSTLLGTPEAFVGTACEAITMNVDDSAAGGCFPVMILSSNIDMKGITAENFHLCEAVLKGLDTQLKSANLVLLTGETAIMKDSITAFCDTGAPDQLIMTWSMTSLGLASTDIPPNGSTIKAGMPIVGFEDAGYRCNGGTKFTNIIRQKWGPNISDIMSNEEALDFAKLLTTPSQSYAQTIARLHGWQSNGSLSEPLADIRGVAHITGGGVWGKLPDILPDGVGADLHSMPRGPEVLHLGQQYSTEIGDPMSDRECYGTFHGGCGMMVVCESESDADTIMDEAELDGHKASIVGETVSTKKGEIIITSRFSDGGRLSSLQKN